MAENNKHFKSLLDLVTFDQKVFEAQAAITKEHTAIAEIKNGITALQAKTNAEKEVLEEAHRTVKKHELDMKELDEKEKLKSKQLSTVESDIEYKSIKKEIDFLKSQQHELETVLVDAWNKAEQVQKKVEQLQAESENQVKELEQNLEKHQLALSEIEKSAATLDVERRPQEEGIPEEWLEKYNMIRQQDTNPISYVVQDTCSSCFYPLTAQDLLSLRQKKLIQCRECYRFLLKKEDPSDETN